MKLMWAMTVLGCVDDPELREAVDFLWSSHLDYIESSGSISCEDDPEFQAILSDYTEMFETIYAIEGKNERILSTLPTRPHPNSVVVRSQFDEDPKGRGGEEGEGGERNPASSAMPMNEKLSGLLSLEASPEYEEYMRKPEGGSGLHPTVRETMSQSNAHAGSYKTEAVVERIKDDISETLDSLGFEVRAKTRRSSPQLS